MKCEGLVFYFLPFYLILKKGIYIFFHIPLSICFHCIYLVSYLLVYSSSQGYIFSESL